MLKVVSGVAKGMKLFDVQKSTTRPITSRIKTSLFDKLHFELQDSVIADLYAGTGGMGIEALSRGASECHFVDLDSDCIAVIHRNLEKTKLDNFANVHRMKVNAFVAAQEDDQFDIILYDPPFPLVIKENSVIPAELDSLHRILSKDGLLVFRHPKRKGFEAPIFRQEDKRLYGSNEITFLRKE